MWGATAKRWRDRIESRQFWFAMWLSFLAGLAVWLAWDHQLVALYPAALGVACAVVRN